MDIMFQDDNGNSALMMAAAENRVQQVKGILTMAINNGTLWQVRMFKKYGKLGFRTENMLFDIIFCWE